MLPSVSALRLQQRLSTESTLCILKSRHFITWSVVPSILDAASQALAKSCRISYMKISHECSRRAQSASLTVGEGKEPVLLTFNKDISVESPKTWEGYSNHSLTEWSACGRGHLSVVANSRACIRTQKSFFGFVCRDCSKDNEINLLSEKSSSRFTRCEYQLYI
jgi:hypothetical protein